MEHCRFFRMFQDFRRTVDSRWRCDENNCNVAGSVNSRTVVASCGDGQKFAQPLLGMIFSYKTVRA